MHPRQMLRELERAMPDGAMVSTDIGNICSVSNSYLRFERPRSMFAAMSFGNCGYAFPTIVGAKVAAPDRPAIAYVGDGAWGMSFGELQTCVREGIPVTAVVFNNGQWGAEKKNHVDFYENRFVGVNLDEQPSWAAVATGDGRRGPARSTSLADVGPALRAAAKAQREGRTTVLEMMVTRELGDPFRRDALALPTRHLAKYAATAARALPDPPDTDDASTIRRCRSLAVRGAGCAGRPRRRAGLSEQADPLHRPVSAGRRHRRRRADPAASRSRPSSVSRSSSTTGAAPRATSAPTSRRRRRPTATRSCSRCRRTRSTRSSTTSCRSTSSATSRRSASRRSIPQILVAHPSVPANNVKELIALAKANPGKLNYASVGTGSPAHIAGELFKLKTGVDIVHVPYKGGGPAVIDTIGGQVQLAVRLDAGRVAAREGGQAEGDRGDERATRSVAAPDVPTIAESGFRTTSSTRGTARSRRRRRRRPRSRSSTRRSRRCSRTRR